MNQCTDCTARSNMLNNAATGGPELSTDEQEYITVLASSTNKANLLGSRRPKPRKMWQRRHVKVLVVGDSGLGKTTLV